MSRTKAVRIVNEREAEILEQLKERVEKNLLLDGDLNNFFKILEELEVIKVRLWKY